MPEAVPIIYTRQFGPPRLPLWGRVLALAIAAACLAVLITAARLEPSSSGVGTHARLGLESCSLLDRARLPCPSCGMTTSFAHFVRGDVLASLYVQPMGSVLAFLAAMCVWVGFYMALTGRPVLRLLRPVPATRYLIPLLAFALLAWGWKMYLQLRGIDGWS